MRTRASFTLRTCTSMCVPSHSSMMHLAYMHDIADSMKSRSSCQLSNSLYTHLTCARACACSLVGFGLQLPQHAVVHEASFNTVFIEPPQHPVRPQKALIRIGHQICMLVTANIHAATDKRPIAGIDRLRPAFTNQHLFICVYIHLGRCTIGITRVPSVKPTAIDACRCAISLNPPCMRMCNARHNDGTPAGSSSHSVAK